MKRIIKKITSYQGTLIFDESKPDGTMRKLLDVEKINNLGWKASIELEDGLNSTYTEFKNNYLHYISEKGKRYLETANL